MPLSVEIVGLLVDQKVQAASERNVVLFCFLEAAV